MDDRRTRQNVELVFVETQWYDVFFSGHKEVRDVVAVAFLGLERDVHDAWLVAVQDVQLRRPEFGVDLFSDSAIKSAQINLLAIKRDIWRSISLINERMNFPVLGMFSYGIFCVYKIVSLFDVDHWRTILSVLLVVHSHLHGFLCLKLKGEKVFWQIAEILLHFLNVLVVWNHVKLAYPIYLDWFGQFYQPTLMNFFCLNQLRIGVE